jgi:hypothetical protein
MGRHDEFDCKIGNEGGIESGRLQSGPFTDGRQEVMNESADF